MHAVTDGHFADTSPCWDPEARFVAFLSSRCLRAVEDALFASLNFTHAQRPYLAMLTADAPNPLAPPPRQPGWEPPEEELGEDEESDDDGDAMPEVRVEPRGLSQRLTAVPVPRARLGQLAALRDGWLLYTVLREVHTDDDGRTPPEEAAADAAVGADEKGTLWRYDLGKRKATRLAEDVTEFKLSADLQTMALLCDEDGAAAVRVHEAGQKPGEQDDDDDDIDLDAPGEASGLVDLEARLALHADAREEWRQMFGEAWAATVRHAHPSAVANPCPTPNPYP